MYKQIIRPLMAFMMVVSLIFSQLALAGYECRIENSAAPLSAHCMTQKAPVYVTCSAHCEKGSQISSAAPNVPTPAFSLITWIQPLPALVTTATTDVVNYAALSPPLIFKSPPLRIQYQVFRI